MHIHLLITDLFTPFRFIDDIGARFPALELLLARGTHVTTIGIGLEAWLCTLFGVDKQQDWPIAPIILQAEKIAEPANGYWLCAAPVHLQVNRDQVLLTDNTDLNIAQSEADAIIQSLNRQFEQQGLKFIAPDPQRWYLQLAHAPELITHPLSEAIGQNIDDYCPSGQHALHWQQIANEIQMLLHDHAVNLQREQHEYPPINGVWLWGGGNMPIISRRPFNAIFADNPIARALALAGSIASDSLPDNAVEWLSSIQSKASCLIVLDQLSAPAQFRDFENWRVQLHELEVNWFKPLLAALRAGQIAAITLHIVDIKQTLQVNITRRELWYFWRLLKPLGIFR